MPTLPQRDTAQMNASSLTQGWTANYLQSADPAPLVLSLLLLPPIFLCFPVHKLRITQQTKEELEPTTAPMLDILASTFLG